MGFSFSFENARTEINRASRLLEGDDGLNLISSHLLSVQSYSIDAWLAAKGYDSYGSFNDSYILFMEIASEEVKQKVSEMTAGWSALEYRLLGDPDDVVEVMPLDEWKKLATTYINDALELIEMLEADATKKP